MSSIYDYVEKEKPKTSSNHSICSFNRCITYPKRTTQLTQQKAKEITTVNVRVENYEQPKMDDHECALTHLMSTDSVRRSHNRCVSGPMVSTWFLTAVVGATPVWWFLWFMQRPNQSSSPYIYRTNDGTNTRTHHGHHSVFRTHSILAMQNNSKTNGTHRTNCQCSPYNTHTQTIFMQIQSWI